MSISRRAGIGLVTLLAATLGASAASEHDNEVFFAIAGIQNFTFTQTGFSITSGQPYSGASGSVTNAGEMAQITVKADARDRAASPPGFSSRSAPVRRWSATPRAPSPVRSTSRSKAR